MPVKVSEAGDSVGRIQSAQGLGQLIDRGPELLDPLVYLLNLLGHLGWLLVVRYPCVALGHSFKATPPPVAHLGQVRGNGAIRTASLTRAEPEVRRYGATSPWAANRRPVSPADPAFCVVFAPLADLAAAVDTGSCGRGFQSAGVPTGYPGTAPLPAGNLAQGGDRSVRESGGA